MNIIKIGSVSASNRNLRVEFDVSEELQKYFTAERVMEIEYSEDISMVPSSILVIPFVCNVLPIAWLADATLIVPELDSEFYEGIPGIRKGYVDMGPMLEYLGDIQVEKLVDNSYEQSNKTAAFFSGGVDAFATLVAHAEERPQLITLWGADVKLTDAEGWSRVRQHTLDTSLAFGLPNPLLVRSNFRLLVNECTLGKLVAASGDGWWHGFQHGIALIAHAAPFAYINRWKTVYIASSYTPDIKVICASDPTIDNEVRLISSQVWHDQYECSRQEKVQNIVKYCLQNSRRIQLRVCWITEGGGNCNVCEKCIRTIIAILAEKAEPSKFGFENWEQYCLGYEQLVRRVLYTGYHLRPLWQDIQKRFRETQAYRQDNRINWIYKLNVDRPLTCFMRLKCLLLQRSTMYRRGMGYIRRRLFRK